MIDDINICGKMDSLIYITLLLTNINYSFPGEDGKQFEVPLYVDNYYQQELDFKVINATFAISKWTILTPPRSPYNHKFILGIDTTTVTPTAEVKVPLGIATYIFGDAAYTKLTQPFAALLVRYSSHI